MLPQLGLEYFCKVEYLTSACEKIKPLLFPFFFTKVLLCFLQWMSATLIP